MQGDLAKEQVSVDGDGLRPACGPVGKETAGPGMTTFLASSPTEAFAHSSHSRRCHLVSPPPRQVRDEGYTATRTGPRVESIAPHGDQCRGLSLEKLGSGLGAGIRRESQKSDKPQNSHDNFDHD